MTRNLLYAILLFGGAAGCKPEKKTPAAPPPPFPHERIEERGVIDVCMYRNFTDYYLHDGMPRGFHHELVNDFVRHMGLKLHVETGANFDEALRGLGEDHYDLVAMSLCVTGGRREEVAFSDPLFYSRWVIVRDRNSPRLDSLRQLAGREVFYHPGSEGRRVLERLRDSLRVSFQITEATGCTGEELLLAAARGEMPLVIAAGHVARVATRAMPRLDGSLALPGAFPVAWALPREATFLLADVNGWLEQFKKSGKLAALRDRYFNAPVSSSLARRDRSRISAYDSIIKENARLIGWDWRLLAALIHQESRFKPGVVSGFGAVGLMQVMPRTAITLGFPAYLSPRDNIRAGIAYLKFLQNVFSRYPFSPGERVKFILAAYNAGPGHVLDAMKLAEAYDHDPYTWENNVDYFLLNKSNPEFYRHVLVNHGYCDGKQVFAFVNEIIDTYNHYQNIIPE
ncbi:MAG: transporter substrate-binding domain-containing protein [Odoribacteraceae bacterium]|jgi:membrane-bound lytic murein transglycosylase F|nr:transporter substrate-binding domain-containing protein [Odoribacteraceae bacterium]